MKNTVYEHDSFYVSVAYNSTYDGPSPDGNLIDETALVFRDNCGLIRYWILMHDVHEIYDGKTLAEAKAEYRKRHHAGEAAFWSDYENENDENT